MSESKKSHQPSAVSSQPGNLCPLCDLPVVEGQTICVRCPIHGVSQTFAVCGRHLVARSLINYDPRLRSLSADEVIRRVIERAVYLSGRKLPSLRQPVRRTEPASGTPATVGQVARAFASRNAAAWRQTVAGFCHRAFVLLAELVLRIWTAGERVPRSLTPRCEPHGSDAIARVAGNPEVLINRPN